MKGGWSDEFVHHWKYFTGHARASPSDLEYIKKRILEKGDNCKVLILGSTPEYRSLCGKLGIKVTCLDFKKYNFDYLKAEVKNNPNEEFFEGNWISTVLDKKFDIILGDNVINMLSKKDISKLFSNVSKMLSENGLFMPRTYIREKGETWTPEKVIENYKANLPNQPLHINTLRNLNLSAYNFEKEYFIFKDLWLIILDLHKKKLITDEELNNFRNYSFENREFYFFIPEKEEFNKMISKYFIIENIFNGSEPYLKNQVPLYILKLK